MQIDTKLVSLSNANMEELVKRQKAYVQEYYAGQEIWHFCVTTATNEYVIPYVAFEPILERVMNSLGDVHYRTEHVRLRVTNPSGQT